MSIFGWSYPPGCSGPPDGGAYPSELEEAVLKVLENSRLSQPRQDKVMELLGEMEREQLSEDDEVVSRGEEAWHMDQKCSCHHVKGQHDERRHCLECGCSSFEKEAKQ